MGHATFSLNLSAWSRRVVTRVSDSHKDTICLAFYRGTHFVQIACVHEWVPTQQQIIHCAVDAQPYLMLRQNQFGRFRHSTYTERRLCRCRFQNMPTEHAMRAVHFGRLDYLQFICSHANVRMYQTSIYPMLCRAVSPRAENVHSPRILLKQYCCMRFVNALISSRQMAEHH